MKALFKSWVDELLKRHTVCADRVATKVAARTAVKVHVTHSAINMVLQQSVVFSLLDKKAHICNN